eukprot:4230939-Amphidinium_carterae.1
MTLDQGKKGLSGVVWMVQSLHLRATLGSDPPHRLHNDVLLSMTGCGYQCRRRVWRKVTKFKRGPWTGQAHRSVLKGAAEEFFEIHTVDSCLWVLLVDDIIDSRPEWKFHPERGSESMQLGVWNQLRNELKSPDVGDDSKPARWFSLEYTSRELLKRRAELLLILLYVGLRRKWWKSWDESPLDGRWVVGEGSGSVHG